jgi:cell wall-associated NlpC family hydrolase
MLVKQRKDKQVIWEDDYVDKVKFLSELAKERIAFLATFRLPGHEESEGSSGGTSAGMTPGNTNEEKAWNFFAGKGFTAAGVAGILGNLKQESSINPTAIQGGGKGPGMGLVQWTDTGRWALLVTWAKSTSKDEWALDTQLEFLWNEMTGGPGADKYWSTQVSKEGGIDLYKTTSDHEAAVRAFENAIEKAGTPNYPRRYQFAKEFLDKFGKGNGGATAVTVGGASATGDAKKLIQVAETWLNKPNRYVFGGGRSQADINAGKFDCSSYCRWCYAEIGKDIMNNGGALWGNTDTVIANKNLKSVKTSELKPGDLVFFDTYKQYGHITIYLGDGKCIGTQGKTGVAVIDMINTSYWATKISPSHRRVL